MPKADFDQLPELDLRNPESKKGEADAVTRKIFSTRLYLDADMVTKIAQGYESKELFIKRYPDLLTAHWLRVNTDLQSLNKLLLQAKTTLLGLTSILFLFDLDLKVTLFLLVGNVASFVFPKGFAKSVVFVLRRFVKI